MSAGAPRLQLCLLGGFHARTAHGKTLPLPAGKVQALLAYLALRLGDAHPRDKLAALLWGETSDERARHSLRQALVALRRALHPECLREEGDTVALNPAAVEVDALAFERLVATGAVEALEQAAALYRGDLLEGLSARVSSFEEWLVGTRERLRELALGALAKLLAHRMKTGPGEAAIPIAVQLLALDPTQEAVHRMLMRLYAEQGRRGAALRQYQRCVTLLQRDLGTEPEAATRRLYQTLLQTVPDSPAEAEPGERASLEIAVPDTPLIGRESEWARLVAAREAAWRGHGKLVAIVGEAGIGKSRLVAELVGDVVRSGGRVIAGRAYESTQVLPFGPWVDALRAAGLVSRMKGQGEAVRSSRAELARLFPELGDPEIPDTPGTENATRLFEALAHFLGALAAERPVLLVLEDLHWADEMSLRLLAVVSRRLTTWPLLAIITMRDDELAGTSLLARILDELDRESALDRIPLTALSREGTGALVKALVKGRTDTVVAVAGLTDSIWVASEGNPFMIVETTRALRENDTVAARPELSLPSRVRALLLGRLGRLSRRARDLAVVAAVVGRAFDFSLIQRAAGLDPHEAAEGVEELVGRRIIHVVDERLGFTHDRIREVAYAELLPPRRAVLHAGVGEALETLYVDRLADVYDQLAFHYSRTDRTEKAVTYLTRLAEKAARAHAHEDALRSLREAADQTPRLPAGEAREARLLDLTLQQAQSLYFLGRFQDSVDLLVREEARLHDVRDARLAARYHFWLGHMRTRIAEWDPAIHSAERAVREAELCRDPATVGQAEGVLAVAAFWTGRYREAIQHGQRSAVLLEKTGESWWLGMTCFYLAVSYSFTAEFDQALEAVARIRAIGWALGDPRLESYAGFTAGSILAGMGESEAAIAECEKSLACAPDPVSRMSAQAVLGFALLQDGQVARAIATLETASQLMGSFRARQWHGICLTNLGEAYLLAGEFDRARDHVLLGRAVSRAAGNRYASAWTELALGRIERKQERWAEAAVALDEALRSFAAIEAWGGLAHTHVEQARLAAALGDRNAAAQHLTEAHRLFGILRTPRFVARTEALAAELGIALTE